MDKPVQTIFGIEFILLATALAIIVVLPLPRTAQSNAVLSSTRLRLPSVPMHNRLDLALGIAVFAPGISATSFVLSLGPALLSKLLHVSSPLVAGGTACLMFMSATGVQFAVKQLPMRIVLLLGAAATAISMLTMITAVHAGAPSLLLAAAVLAGMGQGLGQLGGLTLIGMKVPDQQRAQANSLLNIGAYIPAGLLPVATGCYRLPDRPRRPGSRRHRLCCGADGRRSGCCGLCRRALAAMIIPASLFKVNKINPYILSRSK